MRYLMRQKLFAWGEDFVIKDEKGTDAFFVDGRDFSIGDKLSFQDLAGNELAFIDQELFTFGPTYSIYRNGERYARVKKAMLPLRGPNFTIDIPNVSSLVAAGNFPEHSYTIRRDEATIATVSRQWFTQSDTYGVDIGDGEDVILILAATVAIDLCGHRQPEPE
jgi:uncharacterized protein YxjI